MARYFEDPQDSLDAFKVPAPFLEYLKEKSEGNGVPSGDWSSYNPYDYKDPSSKAKKVEDAPFKQEIPVFPVYNKPEVFERDTPLRHWQKARRRDWTKPPKDQSPAISEDRRYASDVVSEYNFLRIPLEVLESELDRQKIAATVSEVLNKDHHYKNDKKIQRAQKVAINWQNEGNTNETKKGKFRFSVKSSDSSDSHTVIMQFMQSKGSSDKGKRYVDLPVQFACSCPSFLWYGAQWYAVDEQYMYLPMLRKSVMPPTPHTQISRVAPGKGLNFRVCKHILSVYNEIKSWRLETHYKSLVKVSPVSKIMNPKEFERLLGVPFTYRDIVEVLTKPDPMTPKMRNFFRYKVEGSKAQKKALSRLDRWYFTKYRKFPVSKKVDALKSYVNHPEEIFYLLLRDAVVNRGNIPEDLIKEGVMLMSKVIDPSYGFQIQQGNLDAVPKSVEIAQEGLESAPKEEKEIGKGTVLPESESKERYKTPERSPEEEESEEDETEESEE